MPYSERYVAYIDILGFTEIIKRSATNPGLYEALAKNLSEIQTREPIEGEQAVDFQFQAFSDSIVVSTELCGLQYLLTAISKFTLELMMEGLLIRGAIAKGKLHHKNGVMFGPAFIEAYRIEQAVAKYPRVVLSKETYEDHRASMLQPLSIMLSEDGPPCVSIFEPLEMLLGKDDTRIEATKIATRCQIEIQRLLNDSIHSPSDYEKLRWLAIEWNIKMSKSQNKIIFPLEVEFRQRNQLPK